MPFVDPVQYVVTAFLIAAVWTNDPEDRKRRGVVMSEYRGWSIRIETSRDHEHRWHAEVHVRPDSEQRRLAREAKVELPGGWGARADVVLAALELARHYIDLSA